MKTVFITGAGGFAGSRLLDYLRERGYDVVAGVRNRARKLAYERQNDKALVCDVTDPINVARAIASVQPDAVVHLAGISRATDASDEPLEAYQAIVTAWANVLDAVRRIVPRTKVVLASACDVYGDAGRDGHPLTEDTPLQPVTTFGSLKATAEDIAHTFFRDYHLNVTIARPFHYTGPGQPEQFFFAAAARRVAEFSRGHGGGSLRLPDLSCRRELLHVDDVVQAYEHLLRAGRPNEVYNISSGQCYTCREIVGMMAAESGREIPLDELTDGHDSPQVATLCGGNSKLHNELGWTPSRSPQQAVHDLMTSLTNAPVSVSS